MNKMYHTGCYKEIAGTKMINGNTLTNCESFLDAKIECVQQYFEVIKEEDHGCCVVNKQNVLFDLKII